MRKVFTRQGRRTFLPIVGDTVIAICVSSQHGPQIIVADANHQQSIIELADQIHIGRGTDMNTIDPNQPIQLSPLLELVRTQVTVAMAHANGRLELEFSNTMKLEVHSTTGYEAWHFQFPRPGRPLSGDVASHISIHGADGHLI